MTCPFRPCSEPASPIHLLDRGPPTMSDTALQHLPNVQPIDATVRDRVGSTYSKRLREAGRLPAVIYGRDGDCIS
ncbi:MAG: hypothetical protein VX001_04800, partial [Planctomycetota bacterium]|nr:hypothetical protein [Planctomycetota bacterium]